MSLKHYSIRTEQAYTDCIKRFILHFGKRHPSELGAADVEGFLTRGSLSQVSGFSCLPFKIDGDRV
ncbi:MAG: phage integrase N-terminal SAM-like domain-containing protein [Methylococcales bacterium]